MTFKGKEIDEKISAFEKKIFSLKTYLNND